MFNKYYQDELSFLREMGREFSRAYPEAAPFLAEAGSDPDVERLLEGFAFLAGRIREKIEDELPEFTQALMELLWPHYLRPIPSMAVLQFEPLPQASKESHVVPRGTLVDSVPVDGTAARFRTTQDVTLNPVTLDSVELRTDAPRHLRIRLRLPEGLDLTKVSLPSVRLFIQGEAIVARALYLSLVHHVERVTARAAEADWRGKPVELGPDTVRPVGFGPGEALLPTPAISFEGYRLVEEYFAFPAKFLFVDIVGLQRLSELGPARSFDITFHLRRLPEAMPALGTAGFLLNCTPIVNLFPHDADPVRIEPHRIEYRLRPAGTDPAHVEVYSVDRVTGLVKGSAKLREYAPFFSFSREPHGDGEVAYYAVRVEPSLTGEGTDSHLSFVTARGSEAAPLVEVETVSADLTCTNRQLASRLRVGDIRVATPNSPVFARFSNISRVTAEVPPPMGGEVYWRLLAHLAVNYHSLDGVDRLRTLLGLYNFRALVDRQAEQAGRQILQGIKGMRTEPATRLLRGVPLRGLAIHIEMEEDNFAGEGDLYLFASLLNEFFALYVTLNSFSQLTVQGLKYGEVYAWPPRVGRRTIV